MLLLLLLLYGVGILLVVVVPLSPHFPVCALVHRLPLLSTGSLRNQLLLNDNWTSVVERRNDWMYPTDDNEDLEIYSGYHTANITLGMPPQQLTMALDTSSPYFWVIDSRCTDEACVRAPVWNYAKKRFNASASTTLHADGGEATIPSTDCVFEKDYEHMKYTRNMTKGHLYKDVLQIGPLQFEDQGLLLANYIVNQKAKFPIDGFLGLAWPSRAFVGQRPALMNMLDQLDQPVFTIWLDWRRPVQLGGPGGFLTLGGPDNDHCVGPWHAVPLVTRLRSWLISIDGFKIGQYYTFRTQSATVETGIALIGGPYLQINMIIESTHAEYSEENDIYTVQCDQIPVLDPFVLKINDKDFAITPEEYVFDLNLPDGKCALGVFGMYGDGYTADWVLGDVFLDSFCVMFDYSAGRLSLARAKDAVPYRPYVGATRNKFNASQHMQQIGNDDW